MDRAALVLADLYEADDRFDQAEINFKRAMSINAHHPGTLLNYGMFCFRRGRFDEAIELFQSAKAIEPGFRDVESSILFSLNFRQNLDPDAIAREHKRVGAAIQLVAGPPFSAWNNSREPGRRLRVGYVSGDFLHHPVALFLKPILESHNKSNIETYCYSNYPVRNPVGQSLRERSEHWREIHSLSDNDVVKQIRDDRIDVLVDLSGHTARHRLHVFARQPAPVQVTWLGYLNTTGLPGMNYRICDWNTDPTGFESLSTEKLVRMPHCQWCYAPWSSGNLVESPHPLQPDRIVFGSFNQYRKISEACLTLWVQILKRIPNADLLVMDVPQAATRKAFLERVAKLGMDPARVTVRGREIIVQYFNTIGSVDIALDTFPYNGATTTLDTLWSGVPLIALKGDRGISRGSYSILKTITADDLIAESPDEYVEKNVRLALDHTLRRELRISLRSRLQASPAMDVERFVADLECRYRQMWHEWCASAPS
jgi:predicted O-linked N-acetylglucosamine transferase (SPINDLY family)